MGKKIKSTVKFRLKKAKKKKIPLVRAEIIIFNYNSARQKSIIPFGEWSQKAVLVDPNRWKIVNTKSRKLISVKWISFGTENHLYGCYVPDRPTSGLNIDKCAHITKFSRTARMRSTMPRNKFLLFFSRPAELCGGMCISWLGVLRIALMWWRKKLQRKGKRLVSHW